MFLPPAMNLALCEAVSLASTFNENVNKLNALMFSHLDYAVVAERL